MAISLHNDRAAWLKGPGNACDFLPEGFGHPWRLVLLGAPGVGKGTQAELLSMRLGACHLSTGDVFRTARDAGEKSLSPAMTVALKCMKRGELVPDDTVLHVVRERGGCLKCRGGFILDGYPRTVRQAEALVADLKAANVVLDAVLELVLPLEEIITRLSGRRTCPACKAVYHITSRPPRTPGVCDHCGKDLVQREDDRPESIKVRMVAYQRATTPLAAFYENLGKLAQIDAAGTPEQICGRALAELETRRKAAWR